MEEKWQSIAYNIVTDNEFYHGHHVKGFAENGENPKERISKVTSFKNIPGYLTQRSEHEGRQYVSNSNSNTSTQHSGDKHFEEDSTTMISMDVLMSAA